MVECERAKLATGVRFSFTAPHEPDLWVEASVCKTGLPGSIPGRLSNHTFSLSALDAQRRGGCLLNSSERVRLPPRALSPTVPIDYLVWSPGSQPGGAGSIPAGNAGPICRPAVPLEGPRPGGRAHQYSPCPGGQVPCYERGYRGSTPRWGTLRLCPGGSRSKPPKLDVQVRFLAEAPRKIPG